jgi:hypothetical protein
MGGLYETVRPSVFWSLHAAVAIAGGLVLLLVSGRLRRVTGAMSEAAREAVAA